MITELRRIAQGLDQMHDLDARIMAIYGRGAADERARIVATLRERARRFLEMANPNAVFLPSPADWMADELERISHQIEAEAKT